MTKRRFFIVKRESAKESVSDATSSKDNEVDSHKKKDIFKFPYEQSANELMQDEGFIEYVKKNGYHFNKKLAEYVSKGLYEKTAPLYISENQISEFIENSKIAISKKATMGDIIYATNLAHSILYPDLLKDGKSCIIYANKIANASNSYDGIIFCRWTADVIGKNIKIDWEKFI